MRLIHAFAVMAFVASAPAHSTGTPGHVRFDCQFSLVTSQGATAPSPVSISFAPRGKMLDVIRVTDVGGILYPAGNMTFSVKPDGTSVLGGRPMPAERPGSWSGRVGKDGYALALTSDGIARAVIVTLSTKASTVGARWSAQGRMAGAASMPPIMGAGTGTCVPASGVAVK